MSATGLGTPRSRIAPSVLPWDLPVPDREASLDAYRQALGQIYAYSESARTPEQRALAQVRKLERMRALLHGLGTPQASFASILVAGTNGKGSIAAFLASILQAAGYPVGRYTQPHLYSYRERIWAGGQYVSEGQVVCSLEAMEPALGLVRRHANDLGPLTTFDVGTAQALFHFAQSSVELAVVEVGVGGANDATNVLEPVLAVIGPVGIDHGDTLGQTVPEIARQKAGVARRGIDMVAAWQEPDALEATRGEAHRAGARLHVLGEDLGWTAEDPCSGPFTAWGPGGRLDDLTTSLIGRFQRENAALAVGAAQLLDQRGWRVSEAAIRAGVAAVQWPGRFQPVIAHPLTIVDGAHNPISARALAGTVRHYLAGRPITLVVGMSETKDLAATVAEIAPVAQRAIVTRSSHPRACDPVVLGQVVLAAGLEVTMAASPEEAVTAAWESQPEGAVTLVTGSLFLVGDVMEWLWGLAHGGRGSENRR